MRTRAWERSRRKRHVHSAEQTMDAVPHPMSGEPMQVQYCRCGASRMLGHDGTPIVGMQLGRWMEREWPEVES